MSGVDVTGVATDSQDRIYVFNRGEHPVLVFESGGGFLHRWGENLFRRPHRIYIDSHDSIYCTDDEHFPLSASSTWLRDQQAWQSIIMLNSEDVVHWKFRDLPRLAADVKKYGVSTFEILGWDIGGIDHGYPEYSPDPRLGTPGEFSRRAAGDQSNRNASLDLRQHSVCRHSNEFVKNELAELHGGRSLGKRLVAGGLGRRRHKRSISTAACH